MKCLLALSTDNEPPLRYGCGLRHFRIEVLRKRPVSRSEPAIVPKSQAGNTPKCPAEVPQPRPPAMENHPVTAYSALRRCDRPLHAADRLLSDFAEGPSMNNRTSRRTFIKRAAAAGASAIAAGPRLFALQDKAGANRPTVGSGEHTYEVIHDWCRPPDSLRFGNTHGVCEDARGNFYIAHTVHADSKSPDALAVFDAYGAFVRSWGSEYKGGAHGLHLSREAGGEFLYHCDFLHHVVAKTDLKGELVWKMGAPKRPDLYANEEEFKPTNVAVAPSGDFFVSDGYGKSWIHRYNAKAEYLGSFGGMGSDPGKVNCPHGLMVDTRGKDPILVVADRSNRRLQTFTLDGKHVGFVTSELRSPCHFHTRGETLLIPDLEARVTLFDRDNKLITHLGDGENFALRDKPREQFIPGKFIAPHGAIFDHRGDILVVEWVEIGRVTRLRRVS